MSVESDQVGLIESDPVGLIISRASTVYGNVARSKLLVAATDPLEPQASQSMLTSQVLDVDVQPLRTGAAVLHPANAWPDRGISVNVAD